MPVKQKLIWTYPPGSTALNLYEWVMTLPLGQQQDFFAAEERQFALRNQAIAEGFMTIDPKDGDYVWRDESARAQGKGTDSIWADYFKRYLSETGVQFQSQDQKI